MRTHIDLFSGIGGFALAARWAGVETVAFAEIDKYAIRVLERHWPNVPNYGDVRGFPKLSAWLLTAGVPCQPASVAGKRRGTADDRWLWPQALAVVENGSYGWLLFENPTGILSLSDGLEFERICSALEALGYEVQPLVIPASAVGALHRRDRIWIMAHSASVQSRRRQQRARADDAGHSSERNVSGQPALLADTASIGSASGISGSKQGQEGIAAITINDGATLADAQSVHAQRHVNGSGQTQSRGSGWWAVEPDVGRVANGVRARVDRLRCLGNAIVPQVAYELIKRMIEVEECT